MSLEIEESPIKRIMDLFKARGLTSEILVEKLEEIIRCFVTPEVYYEFIICIAMECGNIDVVKHFEDKMILSNLTLEWSEWLYNACKGGNIDCVMLCLANGALGKHAYLQGCNGAAEGGHVHVLEMLIERTRFSWMNMKSLCKHAAAGCKPGVLEYVINHANSKRYDCSRFLEFLEMSIPSELDDTKQGADTRRVIKELRSKHPPSVVVLLTS